MKRKTFITLLVTVVVLGSIIGGVFAGGVAIGKDQGKDEGREEALQELQSQMSQLTSRFGLRDIQQEGTHPETPGTVSPFPGGFGGLMGSGGTMGAVEKVEGNVVTLTTRDGPISVLVGNSTTIQKMEEGDLDDISTGKNITVSGEQNEDGSINATDIFIVPGSAGPGLIRQ